ncbi:hypothetical protein San01_04480 [Streptomyces angustmyceticus]|uniref:Uncharacterized protein n=1 Tax=Streptomyces angustmyceticus TaxID=285578 RepID=A0A5J4L7Y0_9ACTN|nr:hypothetical protein San01_04480 [Streptomyces angustmyceticus]
MQPVPQVSPPASPDAEPIDTATIRETVRLALLLGAGPLDRDAMAGLHEALRGHVALLLPGARTAADQLWRGSGAWYERAARLDCITRQLEQPLAGDPFAAMVKVQLLARDCDWLLDQQTGLPGGTR